MSDDAAAVGAGRRQQGSRRNQLLTHLHELIDANGRMQTAKLLGVNPRTLAKAANTNELSKRMTDALERHRLQNESSGAARQRQLGEDLERRVEALARTVKDVADLSRDGLIQLRDGMGAAMKDLDSRLSALEADHGTLFPRDDPRPFRPSNSMLPGTVLSDSGCAEDEEFGLAGPLVADWRQACAEFAEAEDEPEKVETERRLLEIEIELVGSHEITLPPAEYPWDRFERSDEIRRRNRRLAEVRVEQVRAAKRRLLRRLITFGLWRG